MMGISLSLVALPALLAGFIVQLGQFLVLPYTFVSALSLKGWLAAILAFLFGRQGFTFGF